MREYKLGRLEDIEFHSVSSVIFVQERGTITLYSLPKPKGVAVSHQDVALKNEIPEENVLGGGHCLFVMRGLGLYGGSEYGPVPNEVALEFLPLLQEYLIERDREVNSLIAKMSRFSKSEKERAERWRRLLEN